MSHSLVNIPQARSWRDIPQPVKPRAMSREGRWRLATSALRGVGITLVVAVLAWSVWIVADVLQQGPKKLPAAAAAVPVKNFEFTTDGMLSKAWLEQALALPKAASLMELDLEQLRSRLLTHGQVFAVTLTRKFPDTLVVKVTERPPIARIAAQVGAGEPQVLLVARDGVVFEGAGFDPDKVATWPWLDGVKLARAGNQFQPVAGMEIAAELLAKAQLEAGHLYDNWHSVSLARLASDRELEVRTKQGTLVVFATDADFFLQLAKLNDQMDRFEAQSLLPSKIDLSLGSRVVVAFAPLPAIATRSDLNLHRPATSPVFSFLPNSQPKKNSEL